MLNTNNHGPIPDIQWGTATPALIDAIMRMTPGSVVQSAVDADDNKDAAKQSCLAKERTALGEIGDVLDTVKDVSRAAQALNDPGFNVRSIYLVGNEVRIALVPVLGDDKTSDLLNDTADRQLYTDVAEDGATAKSRLLDCVNGFRRELLISAEAAMKRVAAD